MRINRLIAAVAIVGLFVVTSNVLALDLVTFSARTAQLHDGPLPPGDHNGIPQGANTCPADNVGQLSDGDTIVGSTIGSSDDFVAPCGSNLGGQDEIFEFTVEFPGEWSFDSCTVPACWDTTLSIHEETGGGCPGDIVACDGDGCNVCYYDSLVQTFLVTSSTYYLIVDGWSTFAYGDFTISVFLVVPGCQSDADCDDGSFCNGSETCNTATGQCFAGAGNPCFTYEGYTAPCDDASESCVKLDDCFIWKNTDVGAYYAPGICGDSPGDATWVFDEVQASHHTTGVLDHFTTPIIARSTPDGASPLGTLFLVNSALFTITPGTCNPDAEIAGSQCTGPATVDPQGSPAHDLPCGGTMPDLPNNSGDFARCEVDFFIAFRTSELGAGMAIAGDTRKLGGPGASDEFGINVIWLEDCPPTGSYGPVAFGCPGCISDFDNAEVCAKPGGSCCATDGSCSQTSQTDCEAAGGTFGATGTTNGTDGGCGGDPDGDGVDNRCGDNCPDDANPGQEDCDGDGFGDVCDPEGDSDGSDGDGVCQGVDNCEFSNNPGQEDKDGDGVGDACDPCPNSNPDDADNDGVCDDVDICLGFDDNDDGDGDGVPGNGDCVALGGESCDCCLDADDGEAGALGDDDGDGVRNCNDKCNGVDDAVFGPECDGKIPTVSEWGLVVLALLLLVAGKVYFGRRKELA
ncbi:MAG: thrombospondin type 3 repeat-containing protein [Planctomycetes bacterium]|nr:thrombospondin type 3 repeat-containing protein [Planctomycetota bacterium]